MPRSTAVFLLFIVLAGTAIGCTTTKPSRAEQRRLEREAATGRQVSPEQFGAAIQAARVSSSAALDAATTRSVGWRVLPEDAPWKVILDPDRAPKGSFSAGTVADGVLLGASELPKKGEFHSIIERHQRNQTRWGTGELVTLIQAAAQHVYTTEGGAPLRVGNMSKQKGGDIRWSRSHNSGRDADLAFYVVATDSGESVAAPDLLSFDENGVPRGREDLRFDVVRNWRLVEGLLEQTEINVQWLFISIPLKQMLLRQGAAIGASAEILRRAGLVLHQPTDAPPHADHFHLRIGCATDDRLDGCVDYGPQWDWLDWHQREMLARGLNVAKSFDEGSVRDRHRALQFLSETKSPFAADIAGVWGFWDKDPDVRQAALEVADAQYGWTANALVQIEKLIVAGGTARELRKAYGILRRSRDEMARDFALLRLADNSLAPAERALAAGALGHFMEPELVAPLIGVLVNAAPEVRAAAAEVLRRITNRTDGIDWARAKDADADTAIADWKQWWEANRATSRELWLAEGFKALGVSVGDEIGPATIDALLPLLKADDAFVRYNANRTIREITGRWAPLEQEDGNALTKYWEKWWQKNRERVLSGEISGDDA